jgi:hypothetical protein
MGIKETIIVAIRNAFSAVAAQRRRFRVLCG